LLNTIATKHKAQSTKNSIHFTNITKSIIANRFKEIVVKEKRATKDMLPTLIPKTHLDSFNTSIKALFNKTISKVVKKTTNMNISLPTTFSSATDNFSNAVAVDLTTATVNSLSKTSKVAASVASTTAHHIETSTFPAQTIATFIAGNKNRATTIIVYPTG